MGLSLSVSIFLPFRNATLSEIASGELRRVIFIDFSCRAKRAHLAMLYKMDGSVICIESAVTHAGSYLFYCSTCLSRNFNVGLGLRITVVG